MNKYLLGVILSFGVIFSASAQSKFSIGPNGGVGGSWITNFGDNTESKLAGNAGLALVYSAAEHFGIGLDAKYSFEGSKTTSNNIPITLNLNYVRLPLKAIYFFNSYGNKFRPKIAAGPSFGFLTSAKGKINSTETDVKDSYNSFDFGVLGAAGFNYRLVSNTWLNVDVNYLHGISNISKLGGNSDNAPHNRNLQLNVGVNFGL